MAAHSTGDSGLAKRYATAIFELADADKALDQVADDFRALKTALDESEDLRRLVRSPVLSRDEQAKAMAALLTKMGASDLTRKFVGLVAANRRLCDLDGMIDAYLQELSRRRGEMAAEVVSAKEMSQAQQDKLLDSLRKVYGQKVVLDIKVDPAIIGGLIVRIGSRMVDSSLRTKLAKLQLAMKGVG